MIFRTLGYYKENIVIVNINIEIKIIGTGKSNVGFTVKNLGNEIQNSLIKATNIFAKYNLEFFVDKDIIVEVSSSIPYTSPYLTSLFLVAFACSKLKLDPPRALIIGDIDKNETVNHQDYNIVKNAKEQNIFTEYQMWIDLSYDDIIKRLSAIKIQRWYKRTHKILFSNNKPKNYYFEIRL